MKFRCPDRTCGISTGRAVHRTEVGQRYDGVLVVSSIVRAQVTDQESAVFCPVCGRRIPWRGRIARVIEAYAA